MPDSITKTDSSAMSTMMQAGSESTSGSSNTIDQGVLNLGSMIRELQKQRDELQFIKRAVTANLKGLAYYASYPALLLFRRNLGESVISRVLFLSNWLCSGIVAAASGVGIAYAITLALPVMYGVHVYQIRLRRKMKIRHFSESRGSSWLDVLMPSKPQRNAGTLEPLLLIMAAIVVYCLGDWLTLPNDPEFINSQQIGTWVCAAYLAAMGVGLRFVESSLQKEERKMLLKHVDQQIISTYLASVLNESEEIVDEGFAIAELAKWSPEQLSTLAAPGLPVFSSGGPQGATTFDPAWDNLLDPTPTPAPGSIAGG